MVRKLVFGQLIRVIRPAEIRKSTQATLDPTYHEAIYLGTTLDFGKRCRHQYVAVDAAMTSNALSRVSTCRDGDLHTPAGEAVFPFARPARQDGFAMIDPETARKTAGLAAAQRSLLILPYKSTETLEGLKAVVTSAGDGLIEGISSWRARANSNRPREISPQLWMAVDHTARLRAADDVARRYETLFHERRAIANTTAVTPIDSTSDGKARPHTSPSTASSSGGSAAPCSSLESTTAAVSVTNNTQTRHQTSASTATTTAPRTSAPPTTTSTTTLTPLSCSRTSSSVPSSSLSSSAVSSSLSSLALPSSLSPSVKEAEVDEDAQDVDLGPSSSASEFLSFKRKKEEMDGLELMREEEGVVGRANVRCTAQDEKVRAWGSTRWRSMSSESKVKTLAAVDLFWKSSLVDLPERTSQPIVTFGHASMADEPNVIFLDVSLITPLREISRRRRRRGLHHRSGVISNDGNVRVTRGNTAIPLAKTSETATAFDGGRDSRADTTGTAAALFVDENAETTGTAAVCDRSENRVEKRHDSAPRWDSYLASFSAALADSNSCKICVDKIDSDIRQEIEKYRRQLFEAAEVDACGSDFAALKSMAVPAMPTVNDPLQHREKSNPPLFSACVSQAIKPSVAKLCPKARASQQKELAKLLAAGTWDPKSICSYRDAVKRTNAAGRKFHAGRLFTINVLKHSASKELAVNKARIVFDGARVSDDKHASVSFTETSSSPATFEAARTNIALGCRRGFVSEVADARAAYVQAPLRSREKNIDTWAELPSELIPSGVEHLDRPCVLLLKSLYGHPESGCNWQLHCEAQLKRLGYTEVLPGTSVFFNAVLNTTLIVYVDDFLLTAPRHIIKSEWRRIGALVDIEEPGPLDRYLGCSYQKTATRPDVTDFTFDMEEFVASTTKASLDVAPKGTTSRKVATPFIDHHDDPCSLPPATWAEMAEDQKKGAADTEVVVPRGALADHAAAVLMKALWGARVARPDISVAVTRLARRITKWGAREDKELHRLMCYLFSTPTLKLRGSVHHDTKFWKVRCFADADFVSPDDTSCKSISGMYIVLQSGPEGEFLYPLSWASRKQSSVARSTPEAELAAASLATFGSLIPLSIIFDAVLPHHVSCSLEEDNTAAEQVIGKG